MAQGVGTMTPEGRAKKITIFVEDHMSVGPLKWYSECEPFILAEIRAAVEEEREQNMIYARVQNRLGKAEAFDEAAKIADRQDQNAWGIAQEIRARAKEITK